jgi:ribosomal protein L31
VAFTKDLLDGRIKLSSKIFIDKAKIVTNMKRILGHLFTIQHDQQEQQLHLDECAAEMKRILIPSKSEKNVCKIQSQQKMAVHVDSACHPSNNKKFKIGSSRSRTDGAKSKTFSPKIPEQKG